MDAHLRKAHEGVEDLLLLVQSGTFNSDSSCTSNLIIFLFFFFVLLFHSVIYISNFLGVRECFGVIQLRYVICFIVFGRGQSRLRVKGFVYKVPLSLQKMQ